MLRDQGRGDPSVLKPWFQMWAGHRCVQVAYGVIETTDDEVIMSRREELIAAMATDKQAQCVDRLYLAVVNIVTLK